MILRHSLLAVLLLGLAGLTRQESADLTPFHGFLPARKLRALTPPADNNPNDIYFEARRLRPDPIPAGFEIRYPDYKFTFDIPKDPERAVYIISPKSARPAIKGHHHGDGHGHQHEMKMVAPPMMKGGRTVAPPSRATVAPPARMQRPTGPVRKFVGSTMRPHSQRPSSKPIAPASVAPRPKFSRPRPPIQRPATLTKSREQISANRVPPRPRPSQRARTGAASRRQAVSRPPPTPSVFSRAKGKFGKYPPEQYRVFPGGYARLSTYSSISG